jgi:hypothetical protein
LSWDNGIPSNIFDESPLLKHAEHALLCTCSYPRCILLPLGFSRGFVCVLGAPSFLRSLTAGKGVLAAYALSTDVLPSLRQMSEHQHRCSGTGAKRDFHLESDDQSRTDRGFPEHLRTATAPCTSPAFLVQNASTLTCCVIAHLLLNTIYPSQFSIVHLLFTRLRLLILTHTANMYAALTCHPPLGQTTMISSNRTIVKFTVLIESSAGSDKKWEAALWHNFDDREKWTSLSLKPAPEPSLTVVKASQTEVRRQFFTIDLPGRPKHGGSLSYTITFRASEDEPWKWANEQFSTSDGRLIYQSQDALSDDLTHYIDGLPPYLNISKEQSDSPETLLWSIKSPVNAASGSTSGYSHNSLGRPLDFTRWFALVRLWSPWLAPRQGKNRFQPDKDAILATFEREDGSHLVVLAISGVDDVLTTLSHDGEGRIVIQSRNDSKEGGVSRLVASVGKDLNHAIAAVMYHARKLVMNYGVGAEEKEAELKALADDFKPEWLENWCKFSTTRHKASILINHPRRRTLILHLEWYWTASHGAEAVRCARVSGQE